MSNNKHSTAPTNGQRISIDQAIQHAIKLHAAGQLAKARGLLDQVLKNAPKNGFALHLQGLVLHQMGNTTGGIIHLEQAIKVQPKQAQYLSNLGEMYRCVKRVEKSIEMGKKALKLDGTSASILSNLGLAYFDAGDFKKAQDFQERAIAINPNHIVALNNLGGLLRKANRPFDAIVCFEKVVSIAPNHVDALNNLGAILTERRRPEEAVNLLETAIKVNPRVSIVHCNIGFAFIALEQIDVAKLGFDEALRLDAKSVKAMQGLAVVFLEKKQFNEALTMIQRALNISPENADLYCILGNIHRGNGFTTKALQAYEKAISLDGKHVTAKNALGELLTELGDSNAAEKHLRDAIQLDENNLAARLSLSMLNKVTPNDPNLQWLVAEAETLRTNEETRALPIHFALGKCYDDIKQYDKAFEHYKNGCAIKRKRIKYQADDNTDLTERIIRTFSTDTFNKLRDTGCPSNTPIFILGMPRSGTTLTEQIIASHPSVFGAGELSDLSHLLNGRNDEATTGKYPEYIKDFIGRQYRQLGESYVAQLQERDPTAQHITDKMPANFRYLGPIHMSLPNAKVVHVKRDPVDTCLSQFSKQFKRGQHFSYDLYELGRHYRDYHNLMKHWRAVLPVESFYEVQYEELVADTEVQARALIDYCGLEWNDDCLDFHKTKRSVRTASVTQVRQPIYKTSIERWRSYENHLGPLFEGLGDLAPK